MSVQILIGDVFAQLATLPDNSVHIVVTSPPYWGLRDYGVVGQIGLEPTLGEHLGVMVRVFREIRRVLRPDGTVWLNYGDCYATVPNGRSAADTKQAGSDDRTFRDKPFSTVGPIYDPAGGGKGGGHRGENKGNESSPNGRIVAGGTLKPKDLCMVPNRLAIALQDDGWWVRSEIVWGKPNGMPDSSGRYRPSTAHEKIFLLSKTGSPYYDAEAVRVPPKNNDSIKRPDGWNTGDGDHGLFHPGGCEKGKKPDKQRGHSRRHAGFNDRWDSMTKAEQQANGRLLRNFEPDLSPIVDPDLAAELEVWRIATAAFSDAHFATFPPALVTPCIAAGTSEHGVCDACGTPWRRDVERAIAPTDKAAKTFVVDDRDRSADANDQGANRQKAGHKPGYISANKTLGWVASCTCPDAGVVPATVLDPFGGSGTTGLVVDRMGRDAVLIELNPDYAELARKRISGDAPLLAEVV